MAKYTKSEIPVDLSRRNKRVGKKAKSKNTRHDYPLFFHKSRPLNKPMKKKLAQMLCSKLTCTNISYGKGLCGSCAELEDKRQTTLSKISD